MDSARFTFNDESAHGILEFKRCSFGVEVEFNGEYVGMLDLYYCGAEWIETNTPEDKRPQGYLQFVIHSPDLDDPAAYVQWMPRELVITTERHTKVTESTETWPNWVELVMEYEEAS